ncbi:GAF domain-containing protein [Alicyclobacillus curvatus]|nr:GAF domain-containing protein [Alicyclobacillus curvatus]
MSFRHTSAQSKTSLPLPGWHMLLASIRENQHFLLSTWSHSTAATCRYSEQVRPHVYHLMEYLLSQLVNDDSSDGPSADDFTALVIKRQPLLTVTDTINLLSDFEDLLVTLSHQLLGPTETEHAYRCTHDLCNRLLGAVARHACLPMNPGDEGRKPVEDIPPSSLGRLLSFLDIAAHWPWVAVVRMDPEHKLPTSVTDFVRFDESTSSFVCAPITALVADEVRQQIVQDPHQPVLISENLYFVVPTVPGALPIAAPQYLVRWLRWMTWIQSPSKNHTGSMRVTNAINRGPRSAMAPGFAERLLAFDERLLAARDVSQVLTAVAKDVCTVCGFSRSALFLYNSLMQTVEGIYAHHIELGEVRQIRESERSIPLIHHMTGFSKPMYFEDVSTWMPKHYVQHFQLSSLFVCPIHGPHGQALGLLLVDHAGKPFHSDETLCQALKLFLDRTTLALTRHLQFPNKPVQPVNAYALTTRELEILRLIAEGLDTKAAAKHLHISDYTVSEHISSVMRKLEVKNRTQAVAKALREGVIQ